MPEISVDMPGISPYNGGYSLTNKANIMGTPNIESRFEQIAQVQTEDWTGDSFGNEYLVHYTAYETNGDMPYHIVYEVYADDGNGNGDLFATLYTRADALHLLNMVKAR